MTNITQGICDVLLDGSEGKGKKDRSAARSKKKTRVQKKKLSSI